MRLAAVLTLAAVMLGTPVQAQETQPATQTATQPAVQPSAIPSLPASNTPVPGLPAEPRAVAPPLPEVSFEPPVVPFTGQLTFTPLPVPAATLPCATDAPGTLALPTTARPAGVTGRLGFYAAEYDPVTLTPLRAVALDPGSVYPLASAFKTTVLHSLLRGVDDGRFRLSDLQTTTEAARSIESYSRGTNTLLTLARRMIRRSENTAADLLALRVGIGRVQADLDALGVKTTRVQFTTKAWWSVQAGLVPAVFPKGSLFTSAQRFSELSAADRLKVTRQVLDTVKGVKAGVLEKQLDVYFHGPEYDPDLELFVQNTSTPQEYACLNATLFRGGLSPASSKVFRTLMATGLDHSPFPAPEFRYWGGKPGSGWRLLTLTGYAETATGRVVAYAYFNDRSDARDSEDIERQIIGADAWIRAQVQAMLAR
ncbi:serine hydrolase [Deinococcus sp. UYEF24]